MGEVQWLGLHTLEHEHTLEHMHHGLETVVRGHVTARPCNWLGARGAQGRDQLAAAGGLPGWGLWAET